MLEKNQEPISSGLDRSSKGEERADCRMKGCQRCIITENRIEKCIECDNKNDYFGENDLNGFVKCSHKNEIPSGKGIDSAGKVIRSCQDPQCSNCGEDYQKCMKCIEGRFLHKNSQKCSPCKEEDGKWIEKTFCGDCNSNCNQ